MGLLNVQLMSSLVTTKVIFFKKFLIVGKNRLTSNCPSGMIFNEWLAVLYWQILSFGQNKLSLKSRVHSQSSTTDPGRPDILPKTPKKNF